MVHNDDDIEAGLPDGFLSALYKLTQGHAHLELALLELLAVEFEMLPVEASVMIGRMEIRARLDKLSNIYKARGDKLGQNATEKIRTGLKHHINHRNFAIHGAYVGFRNNSDGPRLYFATSRRYYSDRKTNEALQYLVVIPLRSLNLAADAFFTASEATERLVQLRREQPPEHFR